MTLISFLIVLIQLKSSRNALDNGRGSAGPIRRTRHKAAVESPARGSVKFSSVDGLSPAGNSHFSEGFFPTVKKNLELGGASGSSIFQLADRKPPSSEVGVPPVHPHSSQMARTILEHLERNLPTPKDKSAELELATSSKKIQSSNVTTSMASEQNIFLNFGGRDFSKKGNEGDKKNSAQMNEARVNSFKVPSPENTKVSKDRVNETSSASERRADGIPAIRHGGCAGSSHDFRKNQDFDIKSKNEVFYYPRLLCFKWMLALNFLALQILCVEWKHDGQWTSEVQPSDPVVAPFRIEL